MNRCSLLTQFKENAIKKSLLISGAIVGVSLLSVTGLGVANAATTTNKDSLVDKIASKFNLNKADVQKVFDEDRAQHQADHEAEMITRLDQAVKDGKLSQDQEDKLVAKFKEMKTFMDALKDTSKDERRSAMKTKMDEFKQWAKDNAIPDEFTRPGFGHGGRGHGGPYRG